jgi:hypothetical protein
MNASTLEAQLFSVDEAGRLLGGISPWTLRKHIAVGNAKVTRIGRRVFLDAAEVERIRRDGLPSLGQPRKPKLGAFDNGFSIQIHSGEEQ